MYKFFILQDKMTNIKYLSIAVLLSAFIVDTIIANPFIQGNISKQII